jgi:hypothetical protein
LAILITALVIADSTAAVLGSSKTVFVIFHSANKTKKKMQCNNAIIWVLAKKLSQVLAKPIPTLAKKKVVKKE